MTTHDHLPHLPDFPFFLLFRDPATLTEAIITRGDVLLGGFRLPRSGLRQPAASTACSLHALGLSSFMNMLMHNASCLSCHATRTTYQITAQLRYTI